MNEAASPQGRARGRYEAELATLARAVPDLLEAVISTEDGFELAAIGSTAESAARIAAMTSSMHALGETMAVETALGECHSVVVETDRGKVVIMRIDNADASLRLTVVARNNALLGAVLFAARACAAGAAAIEA
jgi:uncharacterized protein